MALAVHADNAANHALYGRDSRHSNKSIREGSKNAAVDDLVMTTCACLEASRPAALGNQYLIGHYHWTAFTGGLMFILLGVAPGEIASQIHRSCGNLESYGAFSMQAFAIAKEEQELEQGT
jgi:hypothetical protein